MRRVAPAIGLFLLGPFTGEFLLGNLRLDQLGLGLLLAPMYGCGALLIRELARRTGRGWPAIGLLAAAYALIEEGPIDQLLWNDSYAGADLLHGDSFIPALGMSVELTQAILVLHAVWSISVPIAIVESFVPDRRTTPWLRMPGLIVTAVLFVAGGLFVFFGNYAEEHFIASPAQLIYITVVIVALIVLAFRVRGPGSALGTPPAPWQCGVIALAGTSAYWAPAVLITAGWYEWIGVAVWLVVVPLGVFLLGRSSGQQGWSGRHRFAVAAGAMATYMWLSFPVVPEDGGSRTEDLIGNAVFCAVAAVVLVLGRRRVRTDNRVNIVG